VGTTKKGLISRNQFQILLEEEEEQKENPIQFPHSSLDLGGKIQDPLVIILEEPLENVEEEEVEDNSEGESNRDSSNFQSKKKGGWQTHKEEKKQLDET
jgi:hypothetical protein